MCTRQPSATQRFATGFADVPRGALLLVRTPPLWRVAAVPALLSAVLFGVLVVLSVVFGDSLLRLLWETPDAGESGTLLRVAYGAVRLLTSAFLVAVSAVLALIASMVIAQPFLDVLSERTERAVAWRPRVSHSP